MKRFKTVIYSIAIFCLMTSLSQCSSTQKLEQNAPAVFGDVYFQKKTQAVKDLESSLTLYIPINGNLSKTIELDSVYFKGNSAKLMVSAKDKNLYFGRFISKATHVEDFILSSEMEEEHQNKLPLQKNKMPFELLPNECIISFKQAGEVRYYKISNIKEKRLKEVPMKARN